MLIAYDPDLKVQETFETAETLSQLGAVPPAGIDPNAKLLLVSIEDPVLANDTEGRRGQPNAEVVDALWGSNVPIFTAYDGAVANWPKFDSTWPPSIDSVIHLYGQRDAEALKDAKKLLDICCGTGFIGIHAGNKNEGIESIDFADVGANCLATAALNRKFLREGISVRYIESDVFCNLEGQYDVITASAIPATPVYSGLRRDPNPLFEGTRVVEDIVAGAQKHLNEGGKLILSHSNLGNKAFEEAASKYGAKVDKVLARKEVPFRVEFLGDENWVAYLVENHGMMEKNERGYPFWHEHVVKEVSYD